MFSGLPLKVGVIGRPSLWIAEGFWVLRLRLMVKRGPWLWPQASEGEAQHGPFCWIRRIGQGDQHLLVDDAGRIVREVKVAREPEALLKVLGNPAYRFKRIGLEAGPSRPRQVPIQGEKVKWSASATIRHCPC
jgi:hypothetical protein